MKARIFASLMFTAVSFTAVGNPVQRLTITATTPKIAVAPLPAGRQYVDLPDLEFLFLVEPRCRQGWEPRAITLSIADSRRVLDGALLDEHGMSQTSLAVPAAQLAPLPITGFCDAAAMTQEITPLVQPVAEYRIPAALSLHAALICASDGKEEINYATRPLAIRLSCELPVDQAQ